MSVGVSGRLVGTRLVSFGLFKELLALSLNMLNAYFFRDGGLFNVVRADSNPYSDLWRMKRTLDADVLLQAVLSPRVPHCAGC